jgi:hypothetical protein
LTKAPDFCAAAGRFKEAETSRALDRRKPGSRLAEERNLTP